MQIVETANEGLKRAYTVKIPAKDIEARIDAEVKKVAPQVRMPGFRPGKVPANLIKKMHGEALHSDAFNTAVRESVDQLMRDKKLRPALQPKVDLGEGYAQGKDAELSVERTPGTDECPDVAALTRRVEGIRQSPLRGEARPEGAELLHIRVTFARSASSYTALLRFHGAREGERRLEDRSGDCAALGQGRFVVTTCSRPADASAGLGASQCSWAGISRASSASTSLISAAAPEAHSRCPRLVLTEPIRQGAARVGSCPNTSPSASSSALSDALEPTPWAST